MKRNLVYFACSRKKEYVDCVQHCIRSLELFSSTNAATFDILVLHDQAVADAVATLQSSLFAIHTFETFCMLLDNSDYQPYFLRFCCFQWPLFVNYNNALYMDADALVTADLNLFLTQQLQRGVLYVCKQSNEQFNHHYYNPSPGCYTPTECQQMKEEGLYTFLSGTFLFLVSIDMKRHFENVMNMAKYHSGAFMDQPYLNSYFLRIKKVNYLFDDSSFMLDYHQTTPVALGKFYHFAGDPGNGTSKSYHMTNYLQKLIKFKNSLKE